ncbi:MAG: caspase domain-containing protein [Planctomycetota bacterium]
MWYFRQMMSCRASHFLTGLLLLWHASFSMADDRTIVIGVNRNQNPEDADLKCAVADSELFERTLIAGGVPEKSIVRIADNAADGANVPMLKHIHREFRQRLAGMRESDRLILFLSGHAVVVNGEWVFVPYDFDRNDPLNTGLKFSDLRDYLLACPARQKLVLLDCCRSPLKPSAVAEKAPEPVVEEQEARLPLADVFRGTEAVVIAGCRPGLKSYEHHRLGHGYFTLAVVEALQGQADQPLGNAEKDGWIDTFELGRYVPSRVRELAALDGFLQEPVVSDEQTVFRLTKAAESVAAAEMETGRTATGATAAVGGPGTANPQPYDAQSQPAGYQLAKWLFLAAGPLTLWWLLRGFGRKPRTVRSVGRSRQTVD